MKDYRNDIERLKALISYEIMDTPEEKSFNDLAELVSIICNTPAAIISFIDDKKQWYKAKVGTTNTEVPYEETICQYVVVSGNMLEIPNALEDERLSNHPHVHTENGVRFYIGVPLVSDNGHTIGTVCTFDGITKKLSEEQKTALTIIADHVMHLLDISKKNSELTEEVKVILEQKIEEANETIKVTEAAYNTLFKAIEKSNAVIEFSPKGIIESVNDNFLEIIGYSREELIGKKHDALLNETEKENNHLFWESLNKGAFKSGRFKRRHKDGSQIWIQASYSPVLNSSNEVVKVTKIAQNITLEINAEKALEKAKSLADELNVQKDHFIANISHEIRTPINAVLGFTDLLLDEETDTKKLKYLKSVKTSGDNLLHLINDILDLSKIEAGIFLVDSSLFHLYETIENVFSILNLKAEQKNLTFSKSIASNVPEHFIGDKNRLTQILINLLGNAIKFTHEGRVNLNLYLENDSTLKFEVTDTGIGIPNDKLKSIFERFSQAQENTSRQFGGSGLGLNISKLLIEKQGGQINVESTLGKGSKFIFTLPFTISSETLNTAQKQKTKIVSNSTLKILMCEDNEMNQNLMKAVFMETNHSLDIADNGHEGLKLLSVNTYDLILMDIQMPELDGCETATIIRKELKLNVPIIAITAHSTLKERERWLSLGINDYISKPFKKEELFEKIDFWAFGKTDIENTFENEEKTASDTIISLGYLKEMSAGDDRFMKEMLQLFAKQSSENMTLLKESFSEKDFRTVKNIAHKLKTSFSLIGADVLILDIIETENTEETLSENIKKLENQLKNITREINRLLTNT
ncbi:ATP-binding protein [Flavobacterium amniphilum]|uniref:ATP-binding protein n=1 Tax=Flavobacterium amniphilum TaxID=1834035 RepID=UPI00202A19EB|nr:ATP-binding protein [Flavobacterium amniphilum]MCL9805283.1 ATP-binding protein [Flavobacterium amniphilum]